MNSETQKKLLVTGISGFLGWNVGQVAQSQWEVYGTYYSHPVQLPGVHCVPLDLTDWAAIKGLFEEIQPSAVIHTAAQSSPNVCQREPAPSYEINVTASWNLAELCTEVGIPCVFTSTDLVFDGLNGPYAETATVSPVSRYGEQKVLAEVGMLQRCSQVVVCRMPLMFGLPSPSSGSFIQPFLERLRSGESLSLFTDEFRTPVSGKTAAQGLLLALEKEVKGYLHLGGRERVSRYEFGQIMAEVLEIPLTQIRGCRQRDVKMAAPRPPDVSLESRLAQSLGYQTPSIRSELELLKNSLMFSLESGL